MPYTAAFMDPGSCEVRIDAPPWVWDQIDLTTHLRSTILFTPSRFNLANISDANLLAAARWAGSYTMVGSDRSSIGGPGLLAWLGDSGDGGNLYVGPDTFTGVRTIATLITNHIIPRANGLTAGTISASASTYDIRLQDGDSPIEILDALCTQHPDGAMVYRVKPTGVLDVSTQAALFPSTTTPTVLLTDRGGRDGGIDGFAAEFDFDGYDGTEVASEVQVNWNNGANNGRSVVPLSAKNFAGAALIWRVLLDFRPGRRRPPPERWRRVWAWLVTSFNQANKVATREANERSAIHPQIRVTLPDVTDPWVYAMAPGDSVYVHAPDVGLRSALTTVQYRGEPVHPATARVDSVEVPITENTGVYLRRWVGGVVSTIDLSEYVVPEGGGVELSIGTRDRFGRFQEPRKASPQLKRLYYRRARNQARVALRHQRRRNR